MSYIKLEPISISNNVSLTMKLDSLSKALKFFDGESGLDNSQVQYFLSKAFKSGDLSKKEILLDLCIAINEAEFNWISFVKEMNLISNIESFTNDYVKDYILNLVCDLIFTINVKGHDIDKRI